MAATDAKSNDDDAKNTERDHRKEYIEAVGDDNATISWGEKKKSIERKLKQKGLWGLLQEWRTHGVTSPYKHGISGAWHAMQDFDLRNQRLHIVDSTQFQSLFSENKAMKKVRDQHLVLGTFGKSCSGQGGPFSNSPKVHRLNMMVLGVTFDTVQVCPEWACAYLCDLSEAMLSAKKGMDDQLPAPQDTDSFNYHPLQNVQCQNLIPYLRNNRDSVVRLCLTSFMRSRPLMHFVEPYHSISGRREWMIREFAFIRMDVEDEQCPTTSRMHTDRVTPSCMYLHPASLSDTVKLLDLVEFCWNLLVHYVYSHESDAQGAVHQQTVVQRCNILHGDFRTSRGRAIDAQLLPLHSATGQTPVYDGRHIAGARRRK